MQHDALRRNPLEYYSIIWLLMFVCGFVPPLHMLPCFLVGGGGSKSRSASISPPASHVLRFRYVLNLVLILKLRRWMSDCSRAGYWCAETLVSMRLHVAAKIQVFFRDSHAFGFIIALRKAGKFHIPSSGWSGAVEGAVCAT